MEERFEEGMIKGSINSITLEKTEKILEQMKTCICLVEGNKRGTGFFCKITYKNELIPVMITNYHIIDENFIEKNKKIKIKINGKGKLIDINMDNIIYSSITNEYDLMIIKLKEENIYKYLELDDNLFDENSENLYKTESIYILHYPMGDKISVSYGLGIEKNEKYDIKHLCDTTTCSSGGPILNLSTNKVIGIHKGFVKKVAKNLVGNTFNIGTFLKIPLKAININNSYQGPINSFVSVCINNSFQDSRNNSFQGSRNNSLQNSINNSLHSSRNNSLQGSRNNSLNESINNGEPILISTINYLNKIKMILKIRQTDLNQKIYFLDNTKDYKDKNGIFHYHDNLKELNKSNTELYIDGIKTEYKKYFNPIEVREYSICLKFSISITDCSFMFFNCKHIKKIEELYLDTKNATKMDFMFANCTSLESIPDISNWNTKKVISMNSMFSNCTSLKSIPNISKWDLKNVSNKSNIFFNCPLISTSVLAYDYDKEDITYIKNMYYNPIQPAVVPVVVPVEPQIEYVSVPSYANNPDYNNINYNYSIQMNNNINNNNNNFNINYMNNNNNYINPMDSTTKIYNNLINNKNVNYVEQYSFSRYKRAAKTGLINLGDTSYLNAVLQLLGTVRNLSSYFLNPNNQNYFSTKKDEIPLSCAFHKLFVHLYPYPEKIQRENYKPEDLLVILSKKNPIYNSNHRRNPNNLLVNILCILHTELNSKIMNTIIKKDFLDKKSAIDEGIRNFTNSNNSIISNNFHWFELTTKLCYNCSNKLYQLNNYGIYEIDLKEASKKFNYKPFNLSQYLIFQNKKQEKLFCQKCQNNQTFGVSKKIYSSTHYFFFSLNRGDIDNDLLKVPFIIEEYIDLSLSLENKESFSKYILCGIVSYQVDNNKYICFGRSPIDNQWYLYDDDIVSDCDINEAIYHSNYGFIPCLLLYQHKEFL